MLVLSLRSYGSHCHKLVSLKYYRPYLSDIPEETAYTYEYDSDHPYVVDVFPLVDNDDARESHVDNFTLNTTALAGGLGIVVDGLYLFGAALTYVPKLLDLFNKHYFLRSEDAPAEIGFMFNEVDGYPEFVALTSGSRYRVKYEKADLTTSQALTLSEEVDKDAFAVQKYINEKWETYIGFDISTASILYSRPLDVIPEENIDETLLGDDFRVTPLPEDMFSSALTGLIDEE